MTSKLSFFNRASLAYSPIFVKNSRQIVRPGLPVYRNIFRAFTCHTSTFAERDSLNKKLERNISLISLLPFKPINQTNLHSGLKTYLFLLTSFEKAINALRKGDFEAFDAIVGENSCQIRAIWTALNATNCLQNIEPTLEQIAKIREKIATLLLKIPSDTRSKSTLQTFFENNPDLCFSLSFDEAFLFQSFMLTLVKIARDPKPERPLTRNDQSCSKKLMNWGELGRHLSDDLIKIFKEQLSKNSVLFLREKAALLGDTELQHMVAEEYTIKCDRLSTVSYFWSFKTVTELASRHQIPIVMRCWQRHSGKEYKNEEGEKEVVLFFQKESNHPRYKEFKPLENDLNRTALVVEGITYRAKDELPDQETWRKELLEHDVTEYILVHAATHRQFLDSKEDYRIESAPTRSVYLQYKKKDEQIGCSLENPKHFFLNHAYCSTIGDMMKKSLQKSISPSP